MMRALKSLNALLLAIALTGSAMVGGCAAPDSRAQAAQQDKEFYAWYLQLAAAIKADPQYKRIPLDSPDQANEFVDWLHAAYRNQISADELSRKINQRYPGHQYEAGFIRQHLPGYTSAQ